MAPREGVMLAVENVAKVFPGGVTAVDDFSLEVERGELLVLAGPSGCGKTTTLRMVAGLERPTRGSIAIDGRAVDDLRPHARDVSMVFQSFALYPHLSVFGNMAFGLKLRRLGKAEIRSRVGEAAEMLGIGSLLDRMPGQLSGGQQQRVALGKAIVRKPKLFLFDEPLSNLDAPLRADMRQEIRRLHERLGATMLYVTHDQTEAMTLGRRIALMHTGRIQQVARPAELYRHPANRHVAEMIGSPTMNFIEGHVRRHDDRLVFEAEGFELPLPDKQATALKPYADQPVTLGVRPEHITAQASDSPIEATVEAVESLGAESHVYLSVGGYGLIARATPGTALNAGETTRISIAVEQGHFFDPATDSTIV